jgi:hypothetical protein
LVQSGSRPLIITRRDGVPAYEEFDKRIKALLKI